MFLNRVVILFFLVLTSTFFSQQRVVEKDSVKVNTLDEIVITATRTFRQLSSLPMPVSIICKKQIQNTGSTRLKDILLEQTGINFVTDRSRFTGVQLQGMSAEYTMILIDGVPLIGRSSGNLDLNRITVNNIKQIEIVKGPSSSLYGSEALGGVINIITEKPKQNTAKADLSYFTRVGARDELDLNGNFVYRKTKLGLVVGFNSNSGGAFDFSPKTLGNTSEAYQSYSTNLQLTYKFSDKIRLLTSQRYFYESQNIVNIQRDWNSNFELNHLISENLSLDYTFYATRFKTESQFDGSQSLFNQTLFRPEIRATLNLINSSLNAGVGMNFDALDRTFFDKKETFNSKYLFIQYDFNPIKNMNAVVGARFDSHNKYKSAFSPKISTIYTIKDVLKVKASVGFGFKAPDFRQLFFNFINNTGGYIVLGTRTLHELYGNEPNVVNLDKDLKPESSVGYNLGFEFEPIDDLKININLFRNNIKDLINTASLQKPNNTSSGTPILPGLGIGTSVFYYENRDQVLTQGIEFDFQYKILDNLKFSGGYQFLQTEDQEEINKIESGSVFFRKTPSSSSEILSKSDYFGLPNRSKHTANAKFFYTNYKYDFSSNIRLIYRSKYALFDTNDSQNIIDKYDDFVKGNLQVNIAFNKMLLGMVDLQVGIDNLFDEKGLNNQSLFPNNDSVLLLGRTFYGRLRFNF